MAINAPQSPVIESSWPAIWWLSQLQNPIPETLGPLLVPSVAGRLPWRSGSEMKTACGKSTRESPWDRPTVQGCREQELGSHGQGRRSHTGVRGPGMARQSCPTYGKPFHPHSCWPFPRGCPCPVKRGDLGRGRPFWMKATPREDSGGPCMPPTSGSWGMGTQCWGGGE